MKTKVIFWAVKFVLFLFVFVAICVMVTRGIELMTEWCQVQYAYAKEQIEDRFKTVEVVKEYVELDEADVKTLVVDISKQEGINPVITHAIILAESNYNPAAIRFEDAKTPSNSDSATRMKFASHGLMQVMGFNAKRCYLDWPQLYKPADNIRCGLQILKENLKTAKGSNPSTKLRTALRMYNGSGPMAEVYADKVMGVIADSLLTDLGNSSKG
jgi:soluble lytic murein transglycosylase-like protein